MTNDEKIEQLGGIEGIYRDGEMPAVSGDDIRRIESRIGGPLPIGYARFLRAHGAGCFTFREPLVFDVPQIPDGYESINHFFSAVARSDFYLYDVAANHDEYVGGPRRMVPTGLLPIAGTGGGDLLCLDIQGGAVLYWDHESNFLDQNNEPTRDALYPLAPSFSAFLEMLRPRTPDEE